MTRASSIYTVFSKAFFMTGVWRGWLIEDVSFFFGRSLLEAIEIKRKCYHVE